MKNKRNYSAEDGLNVLEYLGIGNITEQEKEKFRENWDKFYASHSRDLIRTIWVLYSEAIPFMCGDGDMGSFMASQLRDRDFGKRLDVTELDKKLREGIKLEQILKTGPFKFIKIGTASDFLSGRLNPYSAD